MAPKRGSKRASTSGAAEPKSKAAKAEKYGCLKKDYEAVVEAINIGVGLNDECKKMLIAMIPHSLCAPSDERDEHQAMAVTMLDEVMNSAVEGLKAGVEAEEKLVVAAEAAITELQDKSKDAQVTLEKAVEVAESTRKAKVEAASHVASLKTALNEKIAAQKKGSAEYEAAKKEKETLEAMMSTEFKALVEGDFEKPAQAKKLFGPVMALSKKISIEESMKAAMPTSLQKKPAERGSFDQMVLTQCEEKFKEQIQQLGKQLEDGAPMAEQLAAAVKEAESALESGKAAQEAAVEKATSATAEQKEATTHLKAAQEAAAGAIPALESKKEGRDAKKSELDAFIEHNVVVFQTLRDKVVPQSVEPEEGADAEMADAAKTGDAAETGDAARN